MKIPRNFLAFLSEQREVERLLHKQMFFEIHPQTIRYFHQCPIKSQIIDLIQTMVKYNTFQCDISVVNKWKETFDFKACWVCVVCIMYQRFPLDMFKAAFNMFSNVLRFHNYIILAFPHFVILPGHVYHYLGQHNWQKQLQTRKSICDILNVIFTKQIEINLLIVTSLSDYINYREPLTWRLISVGYMKTCWQLSFKFSLIQMIPSDHATSFHD